MNEQSRKNSIPRSLLLIRYDRIYSHRNPVAGRFDLQKKLMECIEDGQQRDPYY